MHRKTNARAPDGYDTANKNEFANYNIPAGDGKSYKNVRNELMKNNLGSNLGAKDRTFTFYETIWQRPIEIETIQHILTLLAETRPRGPVVWEVRAVGGKIHYYLGCNRKFISRVLDCFSSLADVRFREVGSRCPMAAAQKLKITRPNLALNTEMIESVVRASLASLSNVPSHESAVVQVVLGAHYYPHTIPRQGNKSTASWMERIMWEAEITSNEVMKTVREKANLYSYDALVRVGCTGTYANYHNACIISALKTLTSAGIRIKGSSIDPTALDKPTLPFRFPLRLSVKEIAALTLLPFGEEALPGSIGLHPKTLLPPNWYHENEKRIFANSEDDRPLTITARDSLEHTLILGPTGAGKSTVMMDMIMQDIEAGRSVMVIDPKADLTTDILARIPEERMQDVVVIDPADDVPVGFNPLSMQKGQSSQITADTILSVFQEIFKENWGIRSQDILSASLLTLAETKDATLMWLPSLITDRNFREKITRNIKDRIALKPFWEQYDAMKDGEQRAMVESSLNKIRQLMFRPSLRNILGQAHPKFRLEQLFYERKIVLVPLNKGLIGADSARLLGSLLVGLTWTKTLSRAKIAAEKRHIVCMYIDELQDYVSLPTNFADALAQARGLGLSITVAHQYRAQLNPDIKAGIDANCRNKIIFGLQAVDAGAIASQSSGELEAEDITLLPRYHIYTNFMNKKRQTGWISGRTRMPSEPVRLPYEAKAISQKKYGTPAEQVEEEILQAIAKPNTAGEKSEENNGGSGKSTDDTILNGFEVRTNKADNTNLNRRKIQDEKDTNNYTRNDDNKTQNHQKRDSGIRDDPAQSDARQNNKASDTAK